MVGCGVQYQADGEWDYCIGKKRRGPCRVSGSGVDVENAVEDIDKVNLCGDLVGTTLPFQGQSLATPEEVVGCEGEGRECGA